MFIMSQFFAIYFIILGYTHTLPTNHDGRILSLQGQVEVEILPFTQIIQFLENPPTQIPPIEFLKLGIQLKSKLDMLVRRAVNAENKNKILIKDQGALEKQNEIFSKMLRILGVRSRAETLVDDLYPVRRPYHVGVAKAYEEILTSTKEEFKNRPCIKVFRQRVSSYGISTPDFVDGIRSIYGSFSDKDAHKMAAFDPLPPEYNDIAGIKEMYKEHGITPDELKVKTAQIILEPLPLSYTTAV